MMRGYGIMKAKYEELFQENIVMTMAQLKSATNRSRESIMRDLKGIGYYSSYNERGKFYTLRDIPEFDELGLWKYQGAYFSSRHTLLDTAVHLISISDIGHTHEELEKLLEIGIQNTLLKLTEKGRITRRKERNQFVYYAANQQEECSIVPVEPLVPSVQDYPEVKPILIIDILVAALRGYDTDSEAHSYLNQTGSQATIEQIGLIFRHYGIGKKTLRFRNNVGFFLSARVLSASSANAGCSSPDF